MAKLSKAKLVQSVVVLGVLLKAGKINHKAYVWGLANIKKDLDSYGVAHRKSMLTAARTNSIKELQDEVLHGTMSPEEFVSYIHVMDHDSGRFVCGKCSAGNCPRRNLVA